MNSTAPVVSCGLKQNFSAILNVTIPCRHVIGCGIMKSKMSTENNHLALRVALAGLCGSMGTALVGVAVTSVHSCQGWPAWAIGLLIAGIALWVTAILILAVSPKRWKHVWLSVLGSPTWLRETYIWKQYGPVCTFEYPKVSFELSQDGQTRIYTARVSLSICLLEKTRNYYPVRVVVDKRTTKFYLEQRRGLVKLPRVPLEIVIGTTGEFLLKTSGNTSHEMLFSWSCYNNPSIAFVDIQQPPYEWVIEGVEVHLANINKFRNLSQRGKVSNAKKAS